MSEFVVQFNFVLRRKVSIIIFISTRLKIGTLISNEMMNGEAEQRLIFCQSFVVDQNRSSDPIVRFEQ